MASQYVWSPLDLKKRSQDGSLLRRDARKMLLEATANHQHVCPVVTEWTCGIGDGPALSRNVAYAPPIICRVVVLKHFTIGP